MNLSEKNSLLIQLIFLFIFCLYFICFWIDFYDFFILLTLSFVSYYVCSSFGLISFIRFFNFLIFFFLLHEVSLYFYQLTSFNCFWCPIYFGLLCFPVHPLPGFLYFFFWISSVNHWLFNTIFILYKYNIYIYIIYKFNTIFVLYLA